MLEAVFLKSFKKQRIFLFGTSLFLRGFSSLPANTRVSEIAALEQILSQPPVGPICLVGPEGCGTPFLFVC